MTDEQAPTPRIARYKPYYFKPVPGRTYFWCSCGRSANQPFCDGSHKGSGFEPVKFVAGEADGEVLLCGCKHSQDRPFCDGAHNNLAGTYELDDPLSESNQNKTYVAHHRDGRFELNGNCYVGKPGSLPSSQAGNVAWSTVVTSTTGAKYQAMFYLEIGAGLSPVAAFGDAEVILFILQGCGEIEISGNRFELQANAGIYVRKGERIRVRNAGADPIKIYASACPLITEPVFGDSMPMNFDATQPRRVIAVDLNRVQRMGDRSFQLLVDKDVGSLVVTQFIGTIPYSKAAPHRHLYEEALIILEGHGMIWTEDLKTKVAPGDVVFLPSKQMHSLQCTDPQGMKIVGVIYPGGNPNINF